MGVPPGREEGASGSKQLFGAAAKREPGQAGGPCVSEAAERPHQPPDAAAAGAPTDPQGPAPREEEHEGPGLDSTWMF